MLYICILCMPRAMIKLLELLLWNGIVNIFVVNEELSFIVSNDLKCRTVICMGRHSNLVIVLLSNVKTDLVISYCLCLIIRTDLIDGIW